VVVALLTAVLGAGLFARLSHSAYGRYYARKGFRYAVTVTAFIALAVVWRPFAGQIGVVLGLFAAGVAFAAQEVIGALAGWLNIMSGGIFRVGDRVEMGGVRGDVIDITPLRTKILEMGTPRPPGESTSASWVGGRQYTGRIVAVSNKATFTQPVFNFTASFEYIWEELTIPVRHGADWRAAESILLEEVGRIPGAEGAQEAIARIARAHPIPKTEIEPRVFVRADQRWLELSARFVVPVRTARTVKDELTRRVLERLEATGIELAMDSLEIHLAEGEDEPDAGAGHEARVGE
jgi:small-conductance mechanosensitive channel